VEALVKAKIEGGDVKRTPAAKKSSGEVVDLLAALQRSVDAAKSARGEKTSDAESDGADDDVDSDSQDGSRPRRTAKKAPAKKAPQKSTQKTAKKQTAKKQAKKAS
jgi:DNA end-binding protein Ku